MSKRVTGSSWVWAMSILAFVAGNGKDHGACLAARESQCGNACEGQVVHALGSARRAPAAGASQARPNGLSPRRRGSSGRYR